MKNQVRVLVGIFVAVLVLALPIVVFAHDHRQLGGKYDVTVGWDKEPAYVNQPNGAGVRVYQIGTKNPVLGVEKTLKVQIAAGGNDPIELALHTVPNKPGYYVADYTPTKTGSYIFTFVGKIENLDVKEDFESGPNRFDDVDDIPAGGIPTKAAATQSATTTFDSDTAASIVIPHTTEAILAGGLIAVVFSGVVLGALILLRR